MHDTKSTTTKKDKTHMIISPDIEQTFDKIHHLFITKTLNQLSMEGRYLKKNHL